MADNYLTVHDEYQLILDPSFVPESGGKDWIPSNYTDTTPDPILFGMMYGDKLKLVDPLASGPNHNRVLTITNAVIDVSDRVIEVFEALNSYATDTTSYEFTITRMPSKTKVAFTEP